MTKREKELEDLFQRWMKKQGEEKGWEKTTVGGREILRIHFTKVPAHSNVKFNELADKLAKTGLLEGNGVPMARPFEEMREYFE